MLVADTLIRRRGDPCVLRCSFVKIGQTVTNDLKPMIILILYDLLDPYVDGKIRKMAREREAELRKDGSNQVTECSP